MKSPAELSKKLARQWEQTDLREQRLLESEDAWPISLPIGRPSPRTLSTDLDATKQHVECWRKVSIGQVVWQSVSFRATAAPVDLPSHWEIATPREWIDACSNKALRQEFEALSALITQTDPLFHSLLTRKRALWKNRPLEEVIHATQLALALEPGCAEGKPLRALSIAGIDTKFFERHHPLVTSLLDLRFDGEASELGLESFLGALNATNNWLLIADLDGNLLPFQKQRVSSADLATAQLPGRYIILIENEQSLHQLPRLTDTLAILGSGLDLTWTASPHLQQKHVAYWGDIDTWGLKCLAQTRANLPRLSALLMTEEVFIAQKAATVPELTHADPTPPEALLPEEQSLYRQLLKTDRGRLEQEFIPAHVVHNAILAWHRDSSNH